MALTNLIKELAGKKITNEQLSTELNVHRNTIANRLAGLGKFSIEEGLFIQKKHFPNLGLAYLFEDDGKPA